MDTHFVTISGSMSVSERNMSATLSKASSGHFVNLLEHFTILDYVPSQLRLIISDNIEYKISFKLLQSQTGIFHLFLFLKYGTKTNVYFWRYFQALYEIWRWNIVGIPCNKLWQILKNFRNTPPASKTWEMIISLKMAQYFRNKNS